MVLGLIEVQEYIDVHVREQYVQIQITCFLKKIDNIYLKGKPLDFDEMDEICKGKQEYKMKTSLMHVWHNQQNPYVSPNIQHYVSPFGYSMLFQLNNFFFIYIYIYINDYVE